MKKTTFYTRYFSLSNKTWRFTYICNWCLPNIPNMYRQRNSRVGH